MDNKIDDEIFENKQYEEADDVLLKMQNEDKKDRKSDAKAAFVVDDELKKTRKKTDKRKKSFKSELFEWVKEIVIALVIVFFIITFIGQLTNVVGKSMFPTLDGGDHIVIEKLTKRFSEMKRYDIVVFPHEKDILYIKRIVAFPGEVVEIKDGKCYVNSEEIDSKYVFDTIEEYGNITYPFTVPDGHYFVLGDNRNNSYDSRYEAVGTVKREDITGRAFFRIWPLNKIGMVD